MDRIEEGLSYWCHLCTGLVGKGVILVPPMDRIEEGLSYWCHLWTGLRRGCHTGAPMDRIDWEGCHTGAT